MSPFEAAPDPRRLKSDVEWALARGLDESDLVPMLERLVATAPPGSGERVFGARHLAERIVARSPWRAALLAREILAHRDDARAWAVQGLAFSLLGHLRAAVRAYRHALALAPGSATCLHNLGHLLDLGLDRPWEALEPLRRARSARPLDAEIAASYALALARAGRFADAIDVLGRSAPHARALLGTWLAHHPPPERLGDRAR